MRILLVEDDTGIASFIVKGLKEAGYAVAFFIIRIYSQQCRHSLPFIINNRHYRRMTGKLLFDNLRQLD